ncbi:helix-turn-helix domain-containing protein [Elizabethkingia miricola]|uniref:helix-turn-helix domain-containing protein n=1 Tax=Elizabethkingia miricola TaxID=172045 RepID=UPI0038916DC3
MKEDINNQIGYYIKKELEAKGVTPKQLENDLGVSQPYISALLTGKKSIGKRIAKKLNELYGLSESIILTGEVSPVINTNKSKIAEDLNIDDLPINQQLIIIKSQNEELRNELHELRQEIKISNLITEISLSSIMVAMGIKKPDVNPEPKTKPKSKSV